MSDNDDLRGEKAQIVVREAEALVINDRGSGGSDHGRRRRRNPEGKVASDRLPVDVRGCDLQIIGSGMGGNAAQGQARHRCFLHIRVEVGRPAREEVGQHIASSAGEPEWPEV